ncbi:CS domain-containing protein 1 [Elsinoe australis]|uniref:CS domain-containing protein 1 n=1 Tax=Elsinoe australis TaxID=40998 RepID=A0A4U7B1K1_9PEZI|nr:CS domain-containing protein 1 [Elsinoe australis]
MQQPTNTTDTAGLKQIVPEVTWAQRSSSSDAEKNHIYLTISVPDVDPKQITLDIQPTYLDFKGYSETKKATYAVKLEFFEEIDPKESKIHHTPRDVELVLRKKELKEDYWPRLLKDKSRVHFLKTNFDKWVDEDEQNEVAEDDDYMSRMGGMGGMPGMEGMGGMPGMGGMGGMPGMGGDGGFGGIDFSKLGAGAGGMDFGGAGDDGEDDDDEMPELEGEENKEGAAGSSSGAKIQEVE